MRKFLCFVLLVGSFTLAQAKPLPGSKPIEPKEFLRVKTIDKVVSGLEIAITRYESRDGKLKVDLVGVVHIGDSSYYNTLNQRLAKYEVVLYELVAPLGAKPAKKNDGLMPKLVGFFLDLETQLAEVNYDKKNFVHADMSFDEMMQVAGERGDDKITLGLSIIVDMLRQNNLDKKKPGVDDDLDFSKIIENPNLLKQKMVKQLVATAETGPTLKKLLVEDRNKKVMQVLASEVKAGKKHIAIFYGAAHNSDFDQRLRGEHGMICVGQEWLVAWDNLSGPPTPPELRLLKMLLK